MTGTLASVTALLLSVSILLVGHGLQLTIAPLLASSMGWSTDMIGYTGSAYFAGFVLGCLTIPRLVTRVGHIRVFAVLVALAVVALLLLGLLPHVVAWMLARGLTGWAFAGIYMVIESWLNERASPAYRGSLLSIYTIVTLVAICLGQLMIGIGLDYTSLIMVAAILLAVGTVPVGLTSSPAPRPIPVVSFRLKEVFKASQVAVVGAFCGGIATSGFWSLGPVVAQAQGMGPEQIGLFMASTILGGAVLQYPLGRLSDGVDRRGVLVGIALLGLGLCLSSMVLAAVDPRFIYLLMFFYGGATFPIYSLCLAHANDNTELGLMEIASVILLMHSAGSVVGPVLVSHLLSVTPQGMFVVSGITLAAFAAWTLWRMQLHRVARRYFQPWRGVPRTTHEIADVMVAPDLER